LKGYFPKIGLWVSEALEDDSVFIPNFDDMAVKNGLAAMVTLNNPMDSGAWAI
jgi:hypothetical protein